MLDGRIELRPDDNGDFDELVMKDANGVCSVHAEMMDNKCLWIGFYPFPDEPKKRVVMWIRSKGKKLVVNAFKD